MGSGGHRRGRGGARRRLREAGDCEAPRVDKATDRVDAVLAAVYLLFNEGYWSTHAGTGVEPEADGAPIRGELCRLALGLGRSLREIFPEEPEVLGLLALMLRPRASRFSTNGAGPWRRATRTRTSSGARLLEELGRRNEATAELERAALCARNAHERRPIRERIARLRR
jgi:RNA polymerase sigma-70 factor (ECF subfamily)